MGWVAIAATVVSAVISAYSAKKQGDAAESAANYQAAVARNNQIIADQYAKTEIQKGQAEEAAKRQETAQRIGAIRAAIGGSGLDPGGETPLRLQSDTARLGEQDAQTIRNNAARAAYGFQVKGMNYAAEASLDEMRGRSAAEGGSLGAWSSIISGAAGVGDKWAKFKSTGVSGFDS